MLGAHRSCRPACSRQQCVEVFAATKRRSKKQVAVSRTLVSKTGHEAQVAGIAAEILKWTQQESQIAGKGIVVFDCVRDGWDANTFHFWERYDDAAAFGTHSTAPKMMELMQQLQPHLEGPIGVSLYSYEDGRLGPAAIQAGPKGEGGLDDATGASGAAGGASYKQTSRAFDLTKVNEHEEMKREEELLASMTLDLGGEKPDAASQPTAAAGGAADGAAQANAKQSAAKMKGRMPLPSVGDFVALAVNVKNEVMGTLCRMLRH